MSTPIDILIPASDIDHLEGKPDVNVIDIKKVTTSKGKDVTCRYLQSPYFDMGNDLCRSLHVLFVSYAMDAAPVNVYALRGGIEHLLEYVGRLNSRTPSQLQIKKYTDINIELFRGFQDFIENEGLTKSHVLKLKSAINKTGDMGILPRLSLPAIPGSKGKTEPLYKDGFESLQTVCTNHIAGLYNKLAFRNEVEIAEPYTASEIMDQLRPIPTRKRLLEFHKYNLITKRTPNRDSYIKRFPRCPDPEIRALAEDPDAIKKFKAIYDAECLSINFDGLTNPFERGISGWILDPARTVKTLLTHNYPFSGNLEDVIEKYGQTNLIKLEDDCDDIIKIINYRTTTANNPNKAKIVAPTIDEILGLYYPTIEDMTAVLIYMMFQSGWNKETVLALDQESYEHPLTGVIEEAIGLLQRAPVPWTVAPPSRPE